MVGAAPMPVGQLAIQGVGHVQLRVHRATQATFEVALEGIRRFKGE